MAINSNEDILDKIRLFKWYSAVDFGNGIIAKTNYPSACCMSPDHIGIGAGKWNYIIRRNLPDLQGKRVLDIGCNNGIMCIMAARGGATDVVGVDNDATWKNWIEQARFIKEALEWRCKTKYPISFVNSDMAKLPKLGLGHFDVVMALCCLYYLPDNIIEEILTYLNMNAEHVVIQCNTSGVHSAEINKRAKPKYMLRALKKAGFEFIYSDTPFFYKNPVVVGSKKPFKKRKSLSLGSVRSFLREKL